MTTVDDRAGALEALRLTPRQARFVATVALHSGYCLRRQYMAFAHLKYGKVVREFLEGLVGRGLAAKEPCRADRGFLYHVHGRAIYRALGQDDNRNRRRASLAAIGRKLMILDFVISEPDAKWFATQDDKVELFTQHFGVPLADLPQQTFAAFDERTAPATRYFVDKLPIFLAGEPPAIHFVALAIEPTGAVFERFLRDHSRLLARLRSWTIVAVSPATTSCIEPCRRLFERLGRDSHIVPSADRTELLEYFNTRRAVEQNNVAGLSVADLNRFRTRRQRFAQPSFDALYGRWLAEGPDAVVEPTDLGAPSTIGSGRFFACELPFKYEQFGDFAGVC